MAISSPKGWGKIWRKAALTVNAPSLRRAAQSRSTFAAANQATCLPYNGSSGNLLAYDYTSCHPRLRCTFSCIRCVAAGPGASKSSAAIPIATTATVSKRRSSSCNDASDYVSVSAGLKEFISGYAAKSADKKFHMPYNRKDLALDLVKVHDDRFSSLGGNKYFACVDMKGTDGKMYDIDFFMAVQGAS